MKTGSCLRQIVEQYHQLDNLPEKTEEPKSVEGEFIGKNDVSKDVNGLKYDQVNIGQGWSPGFSNSWISSLLGSFLGR